MDVTARVRAFVEGEVRDEVSDEEDIFKMGLVSSLFALQLIAFLETEFSINVEGEDLDIDNFCSVSAVSTFVARKRAIENQRVD